jgi:hypothetical protein
VIHDHSTSSRAEQKARKAADKAERAVARYEAKAQKALDKARLQGGAPQLKERVIHTRVPADLDEKLKLHAQRLRVPVSNLIRIILEDAVAGPLELRGAAPGAPPHVVIGYGPFLPAAASPCSRCGATIAAGAAAFLGLTDSPASRLIVCASCVTVSAPEGARRAG